MTSYDIYLGAVNMIQIPSYIQYVRPKMKVIIRVNSVLNNYGYVIVNWTPNGLTGGFEVVNSNPIILDLSVNAVHEIEIPFIRPENYVPWVSLADYTPQLHMVAQSSLIDPTGPKAAIYIERQFVSIGARGVAAQSGMGILAGAAAFGATIKTLDGFIDSADMAVKFVKGIGSKASNVVEGVTEIVNGVGETLDDYGVYDWNGDGAVGVKQTENVTEEDNAVEQSLTHHGGVNYVATNPMGSYAAVHSELENFNTVCYSLPPGTKGDRQTRHRIRDIIRVPQIIFDGKLWTSSLNGVNTNFIPVTPSMPGITWEGTGGVINWTGRSTHLSLFAQMFAWWRGTMKYKIMHYLSPLATAKLEITVTYRPRTAVDSRTDYEYYIVKTINGTTETDVEVPYLWHNDWMTTGVDRAKYDGNHYAWPGPSLLTPTGGSPTDACGSRAIANIKVVVSEINTSSYPAEVPWVIISAPGEDFQLRRYYPRKTAIDAQMKVSESTFSCPIIEKSSAHKRYIIEDDNLTVEDVGRRWSSWYRQIPRVYHHLYDDEWWLPAQYGQLPMDIYLAQMFAMIRGGFDFKLIGELDANQRGISYFTTFVDNESNLPRSAANISPNGMVIRQQSQNNVLEGTAYMEGPTEWFWSYIGQETELRYSMSLLTNYNSTSITGYSRFGKRIQLAYLLPPYTQAYSSAYIL